MIRQGDAEWTESLWGDERLFFSHSFMPNDIAEIRGQLKQGNRNERRERNRNFNEIFHDMPRFDFEKYDFEDVNEEEETEFEPTEATEQDVIDGMVTTGCPFAFLIDQVNSFI